jgi:hypothetical protein
MRSMTHANISCLWTYQDIWNCGWNVKYKNNDLRMFWRYHVDTWNYWTRIQRLALYCSRIPFCHSFIKIQAIVHEQILSTRRAKNTMLLLSDIDALNDKSVISVLNSVRDVCDFDIHASKGFQRVKILSTGSGQTQRPRFQRLFSHRVSNIRRRGILHLGFLLYFTAGYISPWGV